MTSAARELRMPAIPLAGGELRDARHVCGSFEGPLEALRVLMPFIVDGIERGERAVHVVDPERLATHAEWLASAGVDVGRTLETGQLEIHSWQDVYLSRGRFDRASVRSFVLQSLAAGRAGGFPLTRFIGYMEWALQNAPGVEDLVAYESEIDGALRGVADPVICVYNLERHPAGAMAKVLAAHPLGVIDGDLRPEPRRLTQRAGPNPEGRLAAVRAQRHRTDRRRHADRVGGRRQGDLLPALPLEGRPDRGVAPGSAIALGAGGGPPCRRTRGLAARRHPHLLRRRRGVAGSRGLPWLPLPQHGRRDRRHDAPSAHRGARLPHGDRGPHSRDADGHGSP